MTSGDGIFSSPRGGGAPFGGLDWGFLGFNVLGLNFQFYLESTPTSPPLCSSTNCLLNSPGGFYIRISSVIHSFFFFLLAFWSGGLYACQGAPPKYKLFESFSPGVFSSSPKNFILVFCPNHYPSNRGGLLEISFCPGLS